MHQGGTGGATFNGSETPPRNSRNSCDSGKAPTKHGNSGLSVAKTTGQVVMTFAHLVDGGQLLHAGLRKHPQRDVDHLQVCGPAQCCSTTGAPSEAQLSCAATCVMHCTRLSLPSACTDPTRNGPERMTTMEAAPEQSRKSATDK